MSYTPLPEDEDASSPLLYSPSPRPQGLTIHPSGSYSYTYGPAGLQGLQHNSYTLACAFFASIGGLEFGYDQGVIANVLVMKDFMHRWPVTPLQKGTMTAVLELGALLGAITAGIYADRYSRGQAIMLACGIFLVGSLFQCAAVELSHLFIGRAIGGVGVGALSMLCPLYMAEIAPPEVRGSLLALEQFSIVLGVVLGFWAGFGTRDLPNSPSWRIPLGLQIIPGLILLLGALYLPPSPRLLVLQRKDDEARRSLVKLRGRDDVLVQIELLEMKVEAAIIHRSTRGMQQHQHARGGEWSVWMELFSARWRKRTAVGVLIMVFQQWSGINALLYYGPTLVKSIGLKGDTSSLLVAGGIGIMQLLAVGPAIVYIDRVGRKPLLRIGSAIMTLSHLAIMTLSHLAIMTLSHLAIAVLVYSYQDDWAGNRWAAWAAVAGIYIFTLAYGTSFGPIGWVLPSEVFPLSMRSRGVALSTASNWLNNFLIGLLTPLLLSLSPTLTFLTFAVSCLVEYIWATYTLPETAGVGLEEMDEVFGGAVGGQEARVKLEVEEEVGLSSLIQGLAREE